MFNYEVTSVPCTLPSYLSFLPASFQPLRCPRTSPGARFIDSYSYVCPRAFLRYDSPRFTIFIRNYLSGGGHAADRNFCSPLTILPCNIKYVIPDETWNIPSQKWTMKTVRKRIIREKYTKPSIASFRFHYNETRRKKYFKDIAYKSKKKKKGRRKKGERKRNKETWTYKQKRH